MTHLGQPWHRPICHVDHYEWSFGSDLAMTSSDLELVLHPCDSSFPAVQREDTIK